MDSREVSLRMLDRTIAFYTSVRDRVAQGMTNSATSVSGGHYCQALIQERHASVDLETSLFRHKIRKCDRSVQSGMSVCWQHKGHVS